MSDKNLRAAVFFGVVLLVALAWCARAHGQTCTFGRHYCPGMVPPCQPNTVPCGAPATATPTPTRTASPTPPAPTPTPTPGAGVTPTPTAPPTPVPGEEELRTVTRLRLDPTKVTWTTPGKLLLYDNRLQFIYVCPPNDDAHCWKVYFQSVN